MLDKVLAHVARRRHGSGQDVVAEVLAEAMLLHKALLALDTSLSLAPPAVPGHDGVEDGGGNQCALALCCSARFLLYSEYGCSDLTGRTPHEERVALESEALRVAIRGIELMAGVTVPKIARAVVQSATVAAGSPPTTNPLLGHAMYYAATECACFIREGHEREMMDGALTQIVKGLEAMQSQWQVGGTFCHWHLIVLFHAIADSMSEQPSISRYWRSPTLWNE
jgi:hypothetical protein